jgi:hypothetical protein
VAAASAAKGVEETDITIAMAIDGADHEEEDVNNWDEEADDWESLAQRVDSRATAGGAGPSGRGGLGKAPVIQDAAPQHGAIASQVST